MTLVWRSISPILSDKEYRKRRLRYLTPEMGAKEIEPNIVHHDGKQIKFLLLPDAIPAAAYHRLEAALKSADLANCARAANGQKRGKKLTIGWYPQKPIYAKGNGYTNIRTAPTLEQPELVAALRPMLRAINDTIEKELPEYHDFALDRALLAWRPEKEKDDLSRVPRLPEELRKPYSEKDLSALSDDEFNEQYAQWCATARATALPDPLATVENLDPWGMTYTLFCTIFSTVEINRNIVFKAHEDGHNVGGTLVGITALGSFTGGRLVFPRYGYSAELAPRDLLICDNNHELHGNLGPIVGERFSVVAYLYESLLGRSLDDAWDGGRANAPTVWDCHNGKNCPGDAVYVGCRVLNRKGEVIREGTIFGNGTNPLVSHKGALNSESEFRAYAIEKLEDPAFRAEAEKLRGRDLLCWCVQEGKRRAKFCHARVWLELINNSEGELPSAELSTEQRRDFDWGYYEPHFLSKGEADALFEMAKSQPRYRPIIPRSGYQLRRCASTCWSVRDRNDESIGMIPLADAPPEIISLQRKLSALAGKEVNYFSLQAYENERDHIGWHQHREDKCRDARVFIISLGERRSFGVDKLCPECLLCDACNQRKCHPTGPPCSNYAKCRAAKKHRETCAVRKTSKTVLLPEHGSLIALTSEANDWYEHAVLDDREPMGLRISINTKCIPLEDAAAGYVPRELRIAGGFTQEESGS